jgi:hypothetical protein
MMDPYREWGEVTRLAREHKVSRKFLYEQRDKVKQAMKEALQPQRPGPREQVESLEINRDFLRRAALDWAGINDVPSLDELMNLLLNHQPVLATV